MTEKHLDECLARLDDTRRLLDKIQTDLRGAQEFRDAVFDLLEGTPFHSRTDNIYDGFYGRLRAALAAAPAAAPAPAQAEGWQPIETAPKDGTTIIAYEPGGTYPSGNAFPACVGTAYWRNADTLNPGMWCGPYNPRDYPTHWMPLPVPPSAPDAETP